MQQASIQTMHCRVCGNPDIRVIDRIETPNCDTAVPVCHCSTCGHYSLFPEQYQQQKAFEWDGVGYYLRDLERRRQATSQVLDRLCSAYRKANGKAPGSFLDVGCALGWSLSLAESRGMKAVGVEPESRLSGYGRENQGVDIRHGMLADLDLPAQAFDLVYCEQVLEHIDTPREFIMQLKQQLAPVGQLYIGVPPVFPLNRFTTFMSRKMRLPIPDSVLCNIFHDPDEHISVFSRRSVKRLATDAGLHIRPLPLTLQSLAPRRLIKRLLTLGSSPGTWLLSHRNHG